MNLLLLRQKAHFQGPLAVSFQRVQFFFVQLVLLLLSIHGKITVAATIWGAYLTTTEDATNPSQLTYAFFLSDLQFDYLKVKNRWLGYQIGRLVKGQNKTKPICRGGFCHVLFNYCTEVGFLLFSSTFLWIKAPFYELRAGPIRGFDSGDQHLGR